MESDREPNLAKLFHIHNIDPVDQDDFKAFCREVGSNPNTASLDSLEYLYQLWMNEA